MIVLARQGRSFFKSKSLLLQRLKVGERYRIGEDRDTAMVCHVVKLRRRKTNAANKNADLAVYINR